METSGEDLKLDRSWWSTRQEPRIFLQGSSSFCYATVSASPTPSLGFLHGNRKNCKEQLEEAIASVWINPEPTWAYFIEKKIPLIGHFPMYVAGLLHTRLHFCICVATLKHGFTFTGPYVDTWWSDHDHSPEHVFLESVFLVCPRSREIPSLSLRAFLRK